jgi:hypothetical protein
MVPEILMILLFVPFKLVGRSHFKLLAQQRRRAETLLAKPHLPQILLVAFLEYVEYPFAVLLFDEQPSMY